MAITRERRAWRERCPLRAWRRLFGVTQQEVATSLGVAEVTVRGWESGVSKPSGDNLAKLATLIDVDAATLAAFWRSWFAE